jgi:hypothetical protein
MTYHQSKLRPQQGGGKPPHSKLRDKCNEILMQDASR